MFRRWRRQRVLRRNPLSLSAFSAALGRLPLLHGLDGAQRDTLRGLATLFLAEKVFEPVQGLRLSEAERLHITLQACLPVLHLDLDWYDGWSAVIVYPSDFVPRREEIDEAGLVHVYHDPLSGEAWHRGPVILSLAAVQSSGHCDGFNVVIHEMAHKLDMLNGDTNGFPPMHRDMSAAAWSAAFSAAFADLKHRDDAGEDTPIDPYAAQDPGECFAVMSEYFFERPHLLAGAYPQVYRQLALFYRQDPAARLST